MKMFMMLSVLAVAVAAGSFAWADHHEGSEHKHKSQGDHGWFDAEHCTICKPMSENPQLMMSTKWEVHPTKNGMLMVAMAPEGQAKQFKEVCKKMDANIAKAMSGEKPDHLCGFCQAMGGVVQAGAKVEKVPTQTGEITLVTSDNPETVKQIHAVAKRSQEEAEKMAAAMKMKKAG